MSTGPESIDAAALERAIERGLAFLADRQLPSGEFATYRHEPGETELVHDSSPYVTALIAYSLDFCGAPAARAMVQRTLGFLSATMEPGGLWRFHRNTGERDRVHVPLDADDTACVAWVLRRHGITLPDNSRTLLAHRDPEGRFYTYLLSAYPQDVGCVINAHVLLYLGDGPHAQPVIDYLADVVRRDAEAGCDKWYPGPVIFHWALSRCAYAGICGVDAIRQPAVAKVLSWVRPDGALGRDALETALAVLALHNWRSGERALQRACGALLASQGPDGGWPRSVLFHGQHGRTWGSEELTTGFCVEALVRLAGPAAAHPPAAKTTAANVPPRMREPGGHFLHIGFPKAGSTTLQEWFDAHPQLGYAHNAIGGFYLAEEIGARSATATAPPVRWRVTSRELLSVPITDLGTLERIADRPATAIPQARERVCYVLRQMFAEATVLIVTRGFRAAMASTWAQYVRMGGRLSMPELMGRFAGDGYAHIANALDYDAIVALYAHAFGAEQIIVLPFELLRDDPAAFLGVLETRLSLEPSERPATGWLNASLSGPELAWYPLLSRCVSTLDATVLRRRRGQLLQGYVRRVGGPKLGRVVEVLDRVAPRHPPTPEDLPDVLVESCRGRAAGLHELPYYGTYAAEYLNDAR
jgi:hypothetical protein